MTTKITSIAINCYHTVPDGYITYNFDGGTAHLTLDKEDVERLFAVAFDAIMRSKKKMAEAIEAIEIPPQIGYDRDKTIEAD